MPAQDLSTLNGVVFTSDERSPAQGVTYSGGIIATAGYGYYSTAYTYTVTVLNNTYTAAAGNQLATFGELKIHSTDGIHNNTRYYMVLGFANNGFITGIGYTDPLAAAGAGVLQSGGAVPGGAVIFSTDNTILGNFPITFTQTNTFTPACFAAGTRVLTRRGEVAVEDLVEGDEAATVSGEFRPVIWIGSRQVKPDAYPAPDEVHPVRVRAGAFGEGAPARDLRLSPGHAVFVDGALVPVGLMVNGATIVQEQVDQVRYFHVELDAHDVLLAEGLACESYLDDGNREVFANSPEHVDLYGRLDTVDWEGACAPVLRGREEDLATLAAIKAGLHDRAREMGWKVESGSVSLVADGVMIAPMHAAGDRLWFQVPAAGEVALASIAGRPCELHPGALDRRRLGVAVSEVRVDGRALDLDGEAFGEGFLEVEQQDQARWRWTDGLGRLAVQGPALMEVTLRAAATAWTRPAPALRLVQAG